MEEIHPKSPKIILLNKNRLFFPLSHLSSLPACPESFTAQFIRIYFISILSGLLPRAHDVQNGALGNCAHPMQGIPCSPCPPWGGGTGFCSSSFLLGAGVKYSGPLFDQAQAQSLCKVGFPTCWIFSWPELNKRRFCLPGTWARSLSFL